MNALADRTRVAREAAAEAVGRVAGRIDAVSRTAGAYLAGRRPKPAGCSVRSDRAIRCEQAPPLLAGRASRADDAAGTAVGGVEIKIRTRAFAALREAELRAEFPWRERRAKAGLKDAGNAARHAIRSPAAAKRRAKAVHGTARARGALGVERATSATLAARPAGRLCLERRVLTDAAAAETGRERIARREAWGVVLRRVAARLDDADATDAEPGVATGEAASAAVRGVGQALGAGAIAAESILQAVLVVGAGAARRGQAARAVGADRTRRASAVAATCVAVAAGAR